MKEKIAKDAKKNLFLNKLRLIYKVLSQRQIFKPDDTWRKKMPKRTYFWTNYVLYIKFWVKGRVLNLMTHEEKRFVFW